MLRLVAVLAASLTPATFADYRPLSFGELVGGADLIVVTTIASLAGDTFQADVSDVLFGDRSLKTIHVQKFRDWECAKRWTPYATDKKLLLFLTAGDG